MTKRCGPSRGQRHHLLDMGIFSPGSTVPLGPFQEAVQMLQPPPAWLLRPDLQTSGSTETLRPGWASLSGAPEFPWPCQCTCRGLDPRPLSQTPQASPRPRLGLPTPATLHPGSPSSVAPSEPTLFDSLLKSLLHPFLPGLLLGRGGNARPGKGVGGSFPGSTAGAAGSWKVVALGPGRSPP